MGISALWKVRFVCNLKVVLYKVRKALDLCFPFVMRRLN